MLAQAVGWGTPLLSGDTGHLFQLLRCHRQRWGPGAELYVWLCWCCSPVPYFLLGAGTWLPHCALLPVLCSLWHAVHHCAVPCHAVHAVHLHHAIHTGLPVLCYPCHTTCVVLPNPCQCPLCWAICTMLSVPCHACSAGYVSPTRRRSWGWQDPS